MTETTYGPGGYAYTFAETPPAPIIVDTDSVSAEITPAGDNNPAHTEYALFCATTGKYIDMAGSLTDSPVWQTRTEWGTVRVKGLAPSTEYDFAVKARNYEGDETETGENAVFSTWDSSGNTVICPLTVRKASSTISAPYFMDGVAASITLAGKSLGDFGFSVDRITGLDVPKVIPDEELIPGGHSYQLWDEYFAMKRIVLEGHIHGESADDLRLRISYLKSFIATFGGNPWRSSLPVMLERTDMPDRHWMVYYESVDQVETIGKRDISSSAKLKLTMKCPMPYALSNETARLVFTAEAGDFVPVELGNAPSDAFYAIKGESENPGFSVGDMVFHTDFSTGLAYTDVENTENEGVFNPPESAPAAFRTAQTGFGIFVTGNNTITYTAKGNPSDASWVIVLYPQWQSSSRTEDAVVLEHRADAYNYIRVYWDCSELAWVFRKAANGVVCEVKTPVQSFTSGTKIVLGISMDASNAGGMKIFTDGILSGVLADTSVPGAAPDKLTFHTGEGTMQPDALFGGVYGWSRMLSADEMLKIAVNPGSVRNTNSTFSYAGNLAENDLLMLDSAEKTARLFDFSAGTFANALANVAGTIPVLTPGRRKTATDHTQTMIYVKSGAAGMEVRYRRQYL